MNGSALLTLYRSLTRHRLYAILNIGGLALGLAVFLVLFLYVQYERGYDRQFPGWDRIWLVNTSYTFAGFPGINLTPPSGLLEQLEASYPDLHGARMDQKQDVGIRDGTNVTQDDIALVEPGYFKLFPYSALQGDPIATVAQPDGAVVTEKVARQYLGVGDPIGKTLTIAFDGSDHVYRIGAVLKNPPANMTYASGIYVPLPPPSADPSAISPIAFLTIPSAARARQIEQQLPALIDRHPPAGFNGIPSRLIKLKLVPLSAVHLIEPRDRTVVATLGTVGLLTLLIAIVNYVNLATARAGLRAREVGLRKVLGGTRASLVRQFLGEAIATAALAALIALALAELALPFVNTIGGLSLSIDYSGAHSILPPLIVLILAVGGVAGLYPGFVLSRFQTAFYKDDAQRGRLFTIGAVLAVIIGCIGLYGLASFDTARRVKEIGIRKTLGASTRDIMRLLIGQFMRPVILANLIAWPLAYFAMRKWLSGFDDRVALSPLYFLAATLVAIAIAAATVFGQAWRVARAEPAYALRYE